MTILAAAWEQDCLYAAIGGGVAVGTNTTQRDTAYANVDMWPQLGVHESYLLFATSSTDFWLHFAISIGLDNNNTVAALWSLRNGASQEYRLAHNGVPNSGVWNFQKTTNGSTWTTLCSVGIPNSITMINNVYDFHVKIHATTGVVNVYNNGQQIASFSGDTTTQTNAVDRFYLDGHYNSGTFAFTEMIVADVPTIAWRLQTLAPNAAGLYSEWTGAYTDVNENTTNDTNFIVTNVVNNRFLANAIDPTTTTLGSREIKALSTATRIMRSADATPADAQHMVRSNGGDYTSASLSLPADGAIYSKVTHWELNPSTTVKWTLAEAQAVQFGVKAV